MSEIEEALIEFLDRQTDGSIGDIDELQDELRDLQNTVDSLEEKMDQLLDQEEQEEVKKASAEEVTTETKKVSEEGTTRVTSSTIKSIRDRFDLTQKQLAELVGVSSVTISSWESGNSKPQKGNKKKIIELREKAKSEVEEMLGQDEEGKEEPSLDVRSIRDQHGLTQKEFAEKLDVSPATVSNWEQGNSNPQPDTVTKIKNLETEEETEESFTGDAIKEIRKNSGLSQSEFAEQLGVSAGTVSNWERGESSPGPDTVEEIKNLELTDEDEDTFYGQEIKDVRKELDLSQSDLADKLGVSPGTVSNWETGKSQPDSDTLDEIKGLEKKDEKEDTEQEEADEEETTPDSTRIIQHIRDRFDITQQDLADLLDVTPATIGSWERGDTTPQGDNKDRLLDLKDKSEEELHDMLGREEEEESLNIRSIREDHSLTRSKFADEVGVSVQTVYNWEQGQTEPGPENLEKIQNLEVHEEEEQEQEEEEEASLSGDDIKDLREEKELSQSDLAEQLGVSPGTISNWERDESSPGSEVIEQIQSLPDQNGTEDEGEEVSYTGEDLKEYREEQGLSQTELAEQLGVSAGTISNWERGKGSPSEEVVEQLRKSKLEST